MEAPVVGGSSVYDMAHEAVRSEGGRSWADFHVSRLTTEYSRL